MTYAIGLPALGAVSFAAAGSLGVFLGNVFAERIPPFPDGPPRINPPVLRLVIGCAVVGAAVAVHAAMLQTALVAIVCTALVAVFVTDARCGIVPDVFTLGPLAISVLLGVWQHEWWLPFSIAVPLLPFAAAALFSRGRAMGWGDVKLVALGGALLGAQMAILAFAAACFAAAAINYKRGRTSGVIAFAPYLATAIGVTLPIAMWQ